MDINAPDFPENLVWLNSKPLYLDSLRGKVVLIDFWTYSCINCQRTLPYLKGWYEKYKDSGLVIIGVHTPEFEFEKDQGNVGQALEKYGVDWPVVLDNDYSIWDSYSNHYWPAKYLVNHQGKIIYTHFGEGNYSETELEIQKALREAGFKVADQTLGNLGSESVELGQTPELYLGSLRGNLTKISDPFTPLLPDQVYLIGQFKEEKEYLEHDRQTPDLEDVILLKFRAKKVYLVMEAETEAKIYVTIDGVGLNNNGAGQDIEFDNQGRGFVKVNLATLYNLIDLEKPGEHILRISTPDKGVRFYAYTFGS